MEINKICKICGFEQPVTEYYLYITSAGNMLRKGMCRTCQVLRNKIQKENSGNPVYVSSLEEEIWKYVKGYEDRYQVSNLGRVKSIRPNGKRIKERLLKQHSDRDGYLTISLYKKEYKRTKKVHRLVAIAFLENPDGLPFVNHIDGVKVNNFLSNLEWATAKENSDHAIENGLKQRMPIPLEKRGHKGSAHHKSKLNDGDVKDIFFSKEVGSVLAEKYSVNQSTINKVKSRKSWIHITYDL